MDYVIREIKPSEISLLEDFLYEAIYQREGDEPAPRDIINKPEIKVYIEDFGRPEDYCLVAEIEENIVGAIWARILCGSIKGYGNVDDRTPEISISLYKEYRKKGIGSALLNELLRLLKMKGYPQVSLSVDKENYAAGMYQKAGFEVIRENNHDYLMLYRFD